LIAGPGVDRLQTGSETVEPGRGDGNQESILVREMTVGRSAGYAEPLAQRSHGHGPGPSFSDHGCGFVEQCRSEVSMMIRACLFRHASI